MTSIYHTGELATQARAGVQDMARRVGQTIHSLIPLAAQNFLGSQLMAILGTVDANGRVWASLLTGQPGFMQAVNERTVRIETSLVSGDPLVENLRMSHDVGVLVIDLATRRRMRMNGKAEQQPDGSLYVMPKEVYANCPKYIQLRKPDISVNEVTVKRDVSRTRVLTKDQQRWIARADTFFIASFHPEHGADASHRGGNPGFIRVLGEGALAWPDYPGNNMFQTLGNICVNPQAGLLFIDFERGNTLQLTGQAQVIWAPRRALEFEGAERIVEFDIEQAIEIAGVTTSGWRLAEYSPFNPV